MASSQAATWRQSPLHILAEAQILHAVQGRRDGAIGEVKFLALGEQEYRAGEIQSLLEQAEAHFLAAGGGWEIIEFQGPGAVLY